MATAATKKKSKPKNGADSFYRFFNVNILSRLTGIQSDKIYNNLKGRYNSESWPEDQSRIVNILQPAVKAMFEKLGYTIEISKSEKQ